MDGYSSSKQIQYWYESFHVHFINIGLRAGCRKEEINDIISQFFLDLLEKKIDFRTINNPKAYLSTAFRRKLIDHYRIIAKSPVVDTGMMSEEYAEPSLQDALEQVQSDARLITRINSAYKKLPNRCRKAIYLKFYEGLTTDQIAHKTGLSKRTVYNNLFEGIKLLRSELNRDRTGIRINTLLLLLPLVTAEIIF